MGIQFRILGPLEVLRDGVAVQPTSAKQRVLLAVLVVRAGEVVPADTLVDAVWPERPPARRRPVDRCERIRWESGCFPRGANQRPA